MRAILDARPSESTLLVFAMLSGLFHFLGRLAEIWLGPGGGARGELLSRVAGELGGALVFRTMALYALAALAWGLARAFGGAGGAYESRAAFFWAALVAAPVILALTLAETLIAPAEQLRLVWAGYLAYAVAVAAFMAEAHGFRRVLPVLGVILGLAGGLAALAVLAFPGPAG